MIYNVVSMSGGKDSTAMALLAIERQVDNIKLVFADTGHEHAQTYEYVDYLEQKIGIKIDRLKADYTELMLRKRATVETKWRADGVPEDQVQGALSMLHPTGIPFLDMCIYHGRFPSSRARFCSTELKQMPMDKYIQGMIAGAKAVISWQGVRRQESPARAALPERDVEFGSWEPEPTGHLIYRPIIDWTVEEVFAMHKKHGIDPNPLYRQGMGRVGCMPCIHARKDELRQIALRFPEEIDRVAEWERIVSLATKHETRSSRLFHISDGRGDGIREAVDWANTARGGRQRDLIHMLEEQDVPLCSSQYGLCE